MLNTNVVILDATKDVTAVLRPDKTVFVVSNDVAFNKLQTEIDVRPVSLIGTFVDRPTGTYDYIIIYTATDMNATYRLEAGADGSISSNWIAMDNAGVATVKGNVYAASNSGKLRNIQIGDKIYDVPGNDSEFTEYDGTAEGQVYVNQYDRFQMIFVGEATDGTYIDFFNTEDDSGKFRTFKISRNDILFVTQCQNNNIFYMWFHDGATPTTYYDNTKIVKYWSSARLGINFATEKQIGVDFATANWDEIAEISASGNAEEYFKVGDEKTIELSTGEQVTFVILGFNHDTLTAGGKAGITIGMKNLLQYVYMMNIEETNVGGWEDSSLRATLNSTVFNILPTDLQNVIKSVNKKVTAGNQSAALVTVSDKLWLLSRIEITNSGAAEGDSAYEYWKSVKNGSVASNRVKYLSNGTGAASNWWLRSPRTDNSTDFLRIDTVGNIGGVSAATAIGLCFCFCI